MTMLYLDDFAPTRAEQRTLAAATPTPMPEQVKIGYLRAMRKANGGRRVEGEYSELGDLFGEMFNQTGEK